MESNLHRMRYNEDLPAECPIATGVTEGACRRLVRDRMERSGMKWNVPGAQSMLHQRAIWTNGDWDAFQSYCIQSERKRLSLTSPGTQR